MFAKILIANRGEIACRVIATARRLGVAAVTVYSDADKKAKHVTMAGEAVRIGPAPATESYLQGERIIQAALETGAEAIHPGYGFLAENPEFAEAVTDAGLTFIGPPAQAIRTMGLKDAAKKRMKQAGVPIVPGVHGENQDAEFLAVEAARIGYPVLVKARAGGGGKGMRLVEKPENFADALEGARREAQASFGDPACIVEKFIPRARHIEIQVLGDTHGNIVHLFERDCSLQRRHQKVIEEAPAPGMSEEVRAAMGKAACEAARAIGYVGAGTVEFIAGGSREPRADGFWFMEMNTRLQVEHPVTEAITGLDLVELQLRVAAGEPLPFTQDKLSIAGHAIEARVYAEDAAKGFLPATGALKYLNLPDGARFERGAVRIDSGVREGDAITPYYDPMIAKIIVHGTDRAAALGQLSAALAECRVAGVVTNIPFLAALARHNGFAQGDLDTGLIERDLASLIAAPEPPGLATALAALGALGLLKARAGSDPWARLASWRHWSHATQYAVLERDGGRVERRIVLRGQSNYRVEGEGQAVDLTIETTGPHDFRVAHDGNIEQAHVIGTDDAVTVFLGGGGFTFMLPDGLTAEAEGDAGGDILTAPMSGLVKVVRAAPGGAVAKGDPLIVIEAMKMEHTLTAPRAGRIAEVRVAEGQQVADGAVLLTLERDGD